MEKSVNAYIRESFGISGNDIRTYSPLTLAYIGDCVYDIIVRTALVNKGNTSPDHLHRQASAIVRATAQAKMMEALKPHMTEEEADVFRRGRNAKSQTTAKNASVIDYRNATGFEALLGYLYLTDRFDRIIALLQAGGLSFTEEPEEI